MSNLAAAKKVIATRQTNLAIALASVEQERLTEEWLERVEKALTKKDFEALTVLMTDLDRRAATAEGSPELEDVKKENGQLQEQVRQLTDQLRDR